MKTNLFIIFLLFVGVFCVAQNPNRVKLRDLQNPPASTSDFVIFAVNDTAGWKQITEYNGDTVIIWHPTLKKFAFIHKDSLLPSNNVTGSGTTNYLTKFTSSSTIGNANLTDNGTILDALLPIRLKTYTTAGLPTGAQAYTLYNTTANNIGFHTGTSYEYPVKSAYSTGLFTATSVPYADANGRLTHDPSLTYNSTTGVVRAGKILTVGSNTVAARLTLGQIQTSDGNYSSGIYVSRNHAAAYFIVDDNLNILNSAGRPFFGPGGSGAFDMAPLAMFSNSGNALIKRPVETAINAGSGAIDYTSAGNIATISSASSSGSRFSSIGAYNLSISNGINGTTSYAFNAGAYNAVYAGADQDDVNTKLYGSFNKAQSINALAAARTIYGTAGIAESRAEDASAIGGYFKATGSLAPYAIYTDGGKSYFSDNVGIKTLTPPYSLSLSGATDGIGLPRGTTVQQPTITASTAPIRFNTDSTAYEGGYGVGDWRLFASRNWVRTNFATVGSIYSGFTPAADATVGDNIASGDTLTFLGGYGINTSVTGTTVTIEADTSELATQYDVAQAQDGNGIFSVQDSTVLTSEIKVYRDSASDVFSIGNFNVFPDPYGFSSGNYANGIYLSKNYWGENGIYASSTDGNGMSFLALTTPSSSSNLSSLWGIIEGGTAKYGLRLSIVSSVANIDVYDKYALPNATPSATSGLKSTMTWTGNGSTTTPSFTIPTFFTQTANGSVTNTVTETTVTASGVGTLTIPANYLEAGRTIVIKGTGYITNNSSVTLRMRAKLGGTTIGDTQAQTLENLGMANENFHFEYTFTCRSTGASGTIIGQGLFRYCPATGGLVPCQEFDMVNTSTITINTTTTNAIDVTAQWGAASTDNNIVLTNLIVEAKN